MGRSKCTGCLCFLSPCCAITSAILVAAAVTLQLVFPSILQQQIEEQVPLRMGSTTLEQLLSPSVPLFNDIYFFNLTNPEEFEAGAKPQLQEVGPYSYRETRDKTVLDISEDGELLTYNQTRFFVFSQETSGAGLQENDTICTINIPLVAAVALLEQAMEDDPNFLINLFGPSLLRGIFSRNDANLYTCQEATPLAFNYTDDLIEALNENIALRAVGMSLPTPFVNIRVNNSADYSIPSVISTGVGSIEDIGQFRVWQGNNGSVDIWPNGMGANAINGTEGLLFRPFLTEDDVLEVFADDAVRTVRLIHTDTQELNGISVFSYGIENATFESAFTNPENARWGSWNPDGLFFIGPTQDPTIPVFASKAHFLDGDPSLLEKVSGLSPDRELHDSVLNVEPLTGANVQLSLRLQINVQVNQSSDYDQLENVNGTVYFPVLYIDQRSVLTDEFSGLLLASGLSDAYLFMTLVPVTVGILSSFAVISFLASLVSLIFCIKRTCSSSSAKHEIQTGSGQNLSNSSASGPNRDHQSLQGAQTRPAVYPLFPPANGGPSHNESDSEVRSTGQDVLSTSPGGDTVTTTRNNHKEAGQDVLNTSTVYCLL